MRVDFLFLFLFFPVEVGRLGAVTSGRREASVAVSSRRDFSSKWTAVWCVLRRYSVTMRRVFRERVWCVVLQCVPRNQSQADKNDH